MAKNGEFDLTGAAACMNRWPVRGNAQSNAWREGLKWEYAAAGCPRVDQVTELTRPWPHAGT